MIPKIFKSGKSFKSLGAYLLHDAGKANSDGRVAWTHTLNLANDDPGLAIDEMLWTCRAAEDLKRAAGVKVGGRPLENPVKHFSLNWHRSEAPSHEEMIKTTEGFLAHMGWHEHQALIVCHEDKRHPHVHVMLNAVHPETGRALDARNERRQAQAWAKDYEREHGLVFCEGRLKPPAERAKSPHRGLWEKLRQAELQHDKAEVERLAADFDWFAREDKALGDAKEWQALKAFQRQQCEAFFMDGKQAFREVRDTVFREVREEFRAEWRGYFAAAKNGGDKERLAVLKADILVRQNAVLDARRDAACHDLSARRDTEYVSLKREQQERRTELKLAQGRGERSHHVLDLLYPSVGATRDRAGSEAEDRPGLARAARWKSPEKCESAPAPSPDRVFEDHSQVRTGPKMRGPLDIMGGLGLGALGAIAEIGEKLFDGFLGGGETPVPEKPRPPPAEDAVEKEALRASAEQDRTVRQASEAETLLAYWNIRRERGRARD